MSEETKNFRAWILAVLLVGLTCFEEARFGRRHNDSPSFPVQQIKSDQVPTTPVGIPSDSESESAVRIAESNGTSLPGS